MSSLTGNLVMLRALEPDDLDLLYLWENDTSIWWLSNTLKPFSREVLGQYLQGAQQDIFEARQFRFVICLNDPAKTPVGFIDLFDLDPLHQRAGVGILLAGQEQRGKGYGAEALRLLCGYAFSVLFLHQLYCSIPENNEASLKLFRKAGFTESGKQKDWIKTPDGWISQHFLQLLAEDGLQTSS